jgi:hypothetical protein
VTIESRPEHTHMPRPPVVPAQVVLDRPAQRHLHQPRDVVRVTVRGRSVALPGMRVPPAGGLGLLAMLGPGLVAALAGDDAGGIATYSATGAQFGYDLLWVLIPMTIALAAVQEICGRLGAASGRGLLDLIRERFGIGWALLAVVVVLLANGGVTVTEFVGIGAALELFGISRYVSVPLAAALIWYFMIRGSYRTVERVFLVMTLVSSPIRLPPSSPTRTGRPCCGEHSCRPSATIRPTLHCSSA